LDDVEEEMEDLSRKRAAKLPYGSVREADEDVGEELGYDVTSFEGPAGFHTPAAIVNNPGPSNTQESAEERERLRYQQQNVAAAEFYRLESEGRLTGGLGSGMVGATMVPGHPHSNANSSGTDANSKFAHMGGVLARRGTTRELGQRRANELNEIVAVDGKDPLLIFSPPLILLTVLENVGPVDVSTWEGPAGGDRGISDNDALSYQSSRPTDQQSYYFPPDNEKPNWKPFTMRWYYIAMLVTLSLTFAIVQEVVFQLSEKRKHENPPAGLYQFKEPKELSTLEYFSFKYAPTMIAVSYGILWQAVDFEVKRLEPYYQLSKPNGAFAAESLNLDYITFYTFLRPFKALHYHQWAVAWCSIATLLAVSAVPTLQSASITLHPSQQERDADPRGMKYIYMHPVWSRFLTIVFVLIALFGGLLLFWLRRPSGLLSDPCGIAGIAAMANKSHILMDFKDLDTATPEDIHMRLRHRRYILHKSALWQGEFIRHNTTKFDHHKVENPHPLMLRLKAGVPFIIFMTAVLAFIPITLFTRAQIVDEKVPILMTALAVIVKLLYGTLECDIRMMEPFYILSKRHAPSKVLTLDYSGTIPGYMPIKAALNGHILLALVGFGTVTAEVLTVCMSSLSSVNGISFIPTTGAGADASDQEDAEAIHKSRYSGTETFKSFWTSLVLACAILIQMIVIVSFVYARRRHAFLPRQPGTIASVLAFIHQSKMLYDFVDTERLDKAAMEKKLASLRTAPVMRGGVMIKDPQPKTYGLGMFKGRDGEEHCGVDEEELLDDYVHGKRFQDARVRPGWDTYVP
jgi:hypothetical protein